jgi:hypothetical protein
MRQWYQPCIPTGWEDIRKFIWKHMSTFTVWLCDGSVPCLLLLQGFAAMYYDAADGFPLGWRAFGGGFLWYLAIDDIVNKHNKRKERRRNDQHS